MRQKQPFFSVSILAVSLCMGYATAGTLKLHGIFSSHMVLQRDKPITVWGWTDPGDSVSVRFGRAKAEAVADKETGRWAVTFPARPADSTGLTLTVTSGDEIIVMDDIVMGDVWVMNGQSNMAFGLRGTYRADMEAAAAHLPLLRRVGISPNESYRLQTDLPANKVTGWTVCTPETAPGFSSIGYSFGARLQRALQIPIGIVDNARGGASLESLVPRHTFKDDPLAARYIESVETRRAEFDWGAAVQKLVATWQKTVAKQRDKGVPQDKLPPRPTRKDLRSWNVPGRSPSDAAACYNGMFGVFKGLNIKGVLFHQGYNNAMGTNCRPRRYRVLMRLMVQGWREDFNDPTLPVGVIGFCAGSIPQTRDNFEVWSVSPGAFIREAQRLGLADLNDPAHTAFLPAYDVQIPGLHPHKKQVHAVRAARWALNRVYGMPIDWDTASLVSAEPLGDAMLLNFDKTVMPDDMSMVLEGFSIADQSGKFYMAHAVQPLKKDVGIWNTANKNCDTTEVLVWSPLVKSPVAVRYAWATSPMGNLKIKGKPWLPLPSFRTDAWDWPESEDPTENAVSRAQNKAMAAEAAERCETRRMEEAKHAVEILKQREKLSRLKTPNVVILYGDDDIFWLDKPAANWETEAMPLGNGRLGGMVFGGVQEARIQFNVDSLWTGDENLAGDYGAPGMGFYQNFGNLNVALDAKGPVTSYRRELNLTRAVCRVTYEQAGTRFTRETFCSHPDQVLVARMTASVKGRYSGRIRLAGAHDETTTAKPNRLTFTGTLANGMAYEAQVVAVIEGGAIRQDGDTLVFSGCDSLTMILGADTSYVMDYARKWQGDHPHARVTQQVDQATKASYSSLLTAHVQDHQSLYRRVAVDLGRTDPAQRALPMDQRLKAIAGGSPDPDMDELLFQFGRYLLIACSRPGTLPANLQGLWNDRNNPPWHSDYHSNINVQMNYWLAETANLAECHTPLFDLLTASLEPFRKATKLAYGDNIRGFTIRTSHNPFGGMGWKWNIPASAWYAQHFWEHYAFGQDKTFLKTVAYPYLKEVCHYWEDHLKTLPDGRLVAPQGWSPEHGPTEDGVSYDQQIIWDLFSNTMEAAEALGVDTGFRAKLSGMRDRLVGPTIGRWGQLQEWMEDRDDPKDQHRHVSHMFAVYPGRQISRSKTPELARAAAVSLKARGFGTVVGWANAWKTALWARLLDAESAHTYYQKEVSANAFPNLWNGCWPGRVFQIDGNFGITAGAIEMLLQSHAGEIHLLPALPRAWATGSVRGLRARGGFDVDIAWQDSDLVSATLHSQSGTKCTVRYRDTTLDLNMNPGDTVVLAEQDLFGRHTAGTAALPRVLVIGDSISMNYHNAAAAALEGIAQYERIEGNGGPSDRGVSQMTQWLGDYTAPGQEWDVIQFNHGLHDLKQAYDKTTHTWGPHQVEIDAYKKNLEQEIQILKKTGAVLIWCTTTPVPNSNPGQYARRKDEDLVYNEAALDVMRQHPEIQINDLNRVVRDSPVFDTWRTGNNVHFKDEEQTVLGRAVAAAIIKALDSRRTVVHQF